MTRGLIQRVGLLAGPILAVVCYALLPDQFQGVDKDGAARIYEFTHAGRATLAVMVWMGLWWLTEAIDISATALLPLVLLPLLGAAKITDAATPYAHHFIFLFMGGFLLALSMQRWGLDRRIALLTIRFVGTRPTAMVAGFMLTTAMLSAFVSNTATTAMMLPIALSVIVLVGNQKSQTNSGQRQSDQELNQESDRVSVAEEDSEEAMDKPKWPGGRFGVCLMLGIAYAASIGGVATTIGTPPNVFLVSYISDTYGKEISFGKWLLIGVPLAAVFLPIVWFVLTHLLYPIKDERIEGGKALIHAQLKKLGPVSIGEWATFIVFTCTALAWIIRSVVINAKPGEPIFQAVGSCIRLFLQAALTDAQVHGDLKQFGAYVKDSTIAMTGALILFVIPAGTSKREFVMNWQTARKLPWGILILFGGGLSLAAAVKANKVADFLGSYAAAFEGMHVIVLILIVTTGIIFLTELTSNTATTAAMVPILAALAPGLNVDPYLMIVPAALAASCAFMMPVATPPNAIVFGSGYVTIAQMCKSGLWFNLIGIVLITLLSMLLLGAVLGVAM